MNDCGFVVKFIISVYIVLSWCAAYSCSNAYIKRKPGVDFFGFRSTKRGKSSACKIGLQQAPIVVV